ncbi:F0F1 ATP synthase subunit A [Longirhabdus pacifica]|uniref:F0F1 ATP synthase subunit A n=1 Tax=Longirhabdus pacifica TaxID=2305227 RepID=UPI0010090141|nr:F0F1 ATP synthase subunit A [Longirhabdus pacifica]
MHKAPIIEVLGVRLDLSILIMTIVTCIIVFVIARLGARKLSVTNPGKMQNFMEWLIEFVQGIVASTMDMKRGKPFVTLGLTLIMFIFVGNMLGLPFAVVTEHKQPTEIFGATLVEQGDLDKAKNDLIAKAEAKGEEYDPHDYHGVGFVWWKSPTADPMVTTGLALIVILLTHYLGVFKNTKSYFKHYLKPYPVFLPIHIVEEASKLITLSMRLFGNIFAGEIMISVIVMAGVFGIPMLAVWQGFSIFVGSIQAFIFCMLTMVYIAQKTERH